MASSPYLVFVVEKATEDPNGELFSQARDFDWFIDVRNPAGSFGGIWVWMWNNDIIMIFFWQFRPVRVSLQGSKPNIWRINVFIKVDSCRLRLWRKKSSLLYWRKMTLMNENTQTCKQLLPFSVQQVSSPRIGTQKVFAEKSSNSSKPSIWKLIDENKLVILKKSILEFREISLPFPLFGNFGSSGLQYKELNPRRFYRLII